MAITKDQKKQIIAGYVQELKSANNIVIVQQKAVSVNAATKMRKDLAGTQGKFNIIRKRLFLRAVKEVGLDEIDISALDGQVAAVFAKGDENAPMKVINKYLKQFKEDEKGMVLTFLGGWFGKKRESGEYVNELANMPSKEELLSKLAYLFNYPLTSFACVLSEIAKKLEKSAPAPKIEAASAPAAETPAAAPAA